MSKYVYFSQKFNLNNEALRQILPCYFVNNSRTVVLTIVLCRNKNVVFKIFYKKDSMCCCCNVCCLSVKKNLIAKNAKLKNIYGKATSWRNYFHHVQQQQQQNRTKIRKKQKPIQPIIIKWATRSVQTGLSPNKQLHGGVNFDISCKTHHTHRRRSFTSIQLNIPQMIR